jgi:hypothetical protein
MSFSLAEKYLTPTGLPMGRIVREHLEHAKSKQGMQRFLGHLGALSGLPRNLPRSLFIPEEVFPGAVNLPMSELHRIKFPPPMWAFRHSKTNRFSSRYSPLSATA